MRRKKTDFAHQNPTHPWPAPRCGSRHWRCSGISPPGCSTIVPRRARGRLVHKGSTRGSRGRSSCVPAAPALASSAPRDNRRRSWCCSSPAGPSPSTCNWGWTLCVRTHTHTQTQTHVFYIYIQGNVCERKNDSWQRRKQQVFAYACSFYLTFMAIKVVIFQQIKP